MASHDFPACATFRGGRCTCDEASNLEDSELDIERDFAPEQLPADIKYAGVMERLEAQPGDLFVLTTERPLTTDQLRKLKNHFLEATGSKHKLLVLQPGLKLGLVGAAVQTSAQPDPLKALQAEAAKSERRAITFGNILHNHILAMQAAIIEAEINGPAEGLKWISNTLFGPGHLPDVEAARALGGAQAWFDAETRAEEERIDTLKAAGHLPDPPPAVWASARPYGHAGTHFVHWHDEKGQWFEQELDAFPTPADIPPGAVCMEVALPIIGRQTVFDKSIPTHPPVEHAIGRVQ